MSRKNPAMALKHAKARKMAAQISNQQKTDRSAMELHFGDWSVPTNGAGSYFSKTKPNRTIYEKMALRRLGA